MHVRCLVVGHAEEGREGEAEDDEEEEEEEVEHVAQEEFVALTQSMLDRAREQQETLQQALQDG
jgi:hypothetical protein